ncbi:MAG: MarC family protein [Ignavibacteriaceae bacterium]
MTSELLTFALTVFMGFFAIMNPIANTPVFLGLVGNRDEAERKKIAKTSCITAFLIVVCFVILGKYLFQLFGITIPAFKITGGILLFYVGFEMLQSKPSSIHHQQNIETDDGVAISPLAIPILAGPGTIVTAMSNVTGGSYLQAAIVIVIFAVMILLTYLAFSTSELIVKKLGNHLILVIGKIMGLILAIMGTGMVIDVIKLAFSL